jgi:hypothetical protein
MFSPGDLVPDVPWDEVSLRKLADQGNAATIAMLDLCSAEQATAVGVKDVAEQAGISEGAVRGQLAGLTMRLKNPAYGFAQTTWPVTITWLPEALLATGWIPGSPLPGGPSGRNWHHRLQTHRRQTARTKPVRGSQLCALSPQGLRSLGQMRTFLAPGDDA